MASQLRPADNLLETAGCRDSVLYASEKEVLKFFFGTVAVEWKISALKRFWAFGRHAGLGKCEHNRTVSAPADDLYSNPNAWLLLYDCSQQYGLST